MSFRVCKADRQSRGGVGRTIAGLMNLNSGLQVTRGSDIEAGIGALKNTDPPEGSRVHLTYPARRLALRLPAVAQDIRRDQRASRTSAELRRFFEWRRQGSNLHLRLRDALPIELPPPGSVHSSRAEPVCKKATGKWKPEAAYETLTMPARRGRASQTAISTCQE